MGYYGWWVKRAPSSAFLLGSRASHEAVPVGIEPSRLSVSSTSSIPLPPCFCSTDKEREMSVNLDRSVSSSIYYSVSCSFQSHHQRHHNNHKGRKGHVGCSKSFSNCDHS